MTAVKAWLKNTDKGLTRKKNQTVLIIKGRKTTNVRILIAQSYHHFQAGNLILRKLSFKQLVQYACDETTQCSQGPEPHLATCSLNLGKGASGFV